MTDAAYRDGQPETRPPLRPPQPYDGYGFLTPQFTYQELRRAQEEAVRIGTSLPQLLAGSGRLSVEEYTRRLAKSLDVAYAPPAFSSALHPGPSRHLPPLPLPPAHPAGRCRHARAKHHEVNVLNALALAPSRFGDLRSDGHQFALASPKTLRAAAIRTHGRQILDHAICDLSRRFPGASVQDVSVIGPLLALVALLASAGGGVALTSGAIPAVVTLAVSAAFLAVLLPRAVALVLSFRRQIAPEPTHDGEHALPVYTVLVPLFREANVVGDLVTALREMDYPPSLLDIKLITEAQDTATRLALDALDLTDNFDVIVVPPGAPQTKPRALNYALTFATGEFVVIYDAEDRPQPDQLRKAVAQFRASTPDLACCQAALNVDNATASWWSRHFAMEYSALFDHILPAYHLMRFPLPLGGTSNHFRTDVLRRLAAWDAFNVTEDADLGMRLSRHGWSTAMLNSTTWEEAPVSWRTWLPQRTRWMKGWFQTWLVERSKPPTRRYHRFACDLILGGQLLTALVHPWTYALIALSYTAAMDGSDAGSELGQAASLLALTLLLSSYLLAVLLSIRSAKLRGHHRLLGTALTLPVYWLAMSVAAYRALWQLCRAPHLWEKTPHGLSPRNPRNRKAPAPPTQQS